MPIVKKTTIPQRPQYSLPTTKKKPCDEFFRYASLIYGRQGIGKTSWIATFPDVILFSCERVSKGIPCFDFNAENGGVHSWEVFKAGVDLLTKSDRFATVGIDTIDAAYTHCFDYVCKQNGIAHPQDEGYGKAWDAIKKEFCKQMDRIWATGRGIVFTSHSKEIEIQSHSGEKYTRIQPTMSGQAFAFVKAKTDFILYVEYYRDVNGNPLRIMITAGDDVVEAKSAGNLPRFLPFTQEDGVDIIMKAFNGNDVGIRPDDLRSGKLTSKVGGNLIGKARMELMKKKQFMKKGVKS